MPVDWRLPILYSHEMLECPGCGDQCVCPLCGVHWEDCPHPGPTSEPEEGDLYPHLFWEQ